jgi:hypothetical protein
MQNAKWQNFECEANGGKRELVLVKRTDNRRMRTYYLFITLGVLLCCGCTGEPGAPAEQSTYKPVADVRQLMELVVDPAADVVWDAVGAVSTMEGTDEWFPETEEEWLAVRSAAMTLAESGNLLMIGERLKDTGPWVAMSHELVDAGIIALQAADARDPDAILAAGEKIYYACNDCHARYWSESDTPAAR